MGIAAGTGGGPRAWGGSPNLRRAGGDTRGHRPPPLHVRRGGDKGRSAREGRSDEVSKAGAGIWPGPKRATKRRRPPRHTGHRVMSTPVKRNMREATGFVVSSAERLGPRGDRRRHCGEPRVPRRSRLPAPRRVESERHLSYSTSSTTSPITWTTSPITWRSGCTLLTDPAKLSNHATVVSPA